MNDKVIVITGASSGIGAALAEHLGKQGAKLVLAARRLDALREVAARAGGEVAVVGCDVTSRAEVEHLRDEALARFGRVDVWVNNAGRGMSKTVSALTDADLDDMILVNVKSALYGMQAILGHFQARGTGHIINISSVLGRIPLFAPRAAYSAAKHALNALTGSLRLELRAEFPGIHVSTVSPGVVATDFGANATNGGVDSRQIPGAQPATEVAEIIADLIANPRADVYSRPEYQARVVAYFAAEDMATAELQGPAVPARK